MEIALNEVASRRQLLFFSFQEVLSGYAVGSGRIVFEKKLISAVKKCGRRRKLRKIHSEGTW